MKYETEEPGIDAQRHDLASSAISRRTVVQSLSVLALAPAFSSTALASEDAGESAAGESRELRINQRYALFPINSESSSRRVRLVKDGRILRSFTASLGLPAQWWAHLDVSEWRGETLTLSIEPDHTPPLLPGMEMAGRGANETANGELLASVRTSREIWSPETLYREPLRPAFHFSNRRGMSGDPHGVYHAGQYHLFFQHNPYSIVFGRGGGSSWGHAVSTDLIHWRELPIALYPRGDDDFPYSGSGVVDHENTSGWGKSGRPPMVIAFTSTGRGECIAYSEDDGASWTEFEGNPVIRHAGRDPRLLWHPQTRQWVMAVYSERSGAEPGGHKRHGVAFYTSADLKSWQERSWIEGYFECPDLFALPIDGDANRTKWVLSCAMGYYSIGEFDGARFIPDSPRLPGPSGADGVMTNIPIATGGFPLFYAAQTFSDHPEGQKVEIAWLRVEAGGGSFSQLLSFPTTLSLRTTLEGVRLCREPVDAIRSLRIQTYDFPPRPLVGSPLLADLEGEAWDIELVIRMGVFLPVLMNIGGDEYDYQPASQMLNGPKGSMAVPLTDGSLRLRILVDRTTVEIFGDRGQCYGLFLRSNPGGKARLGLRTWDLPPGIPSEGTQVERLSAHSLRSAWARPRG